MNRIEKAARAISASAKKSATADIHLVPSALIAELNAAIAEADIIAKARAAEAAKIANCRHELDDEDTCRLCGENFAVHFALKFAGLL